MQRSPPKAFHVPCDGEMTAGMGSTQDDLESKRAIDRKSVREGERERERQRKRERRRRRRRTNKARGVRGGRAQRLPPQSRPCPWTGGNGHERSRERKSRRRRKRSRTSRQDAEKEVC